MFLPINNKACISNTDSCAQERCFTQVRIFLTFFLVGSVGFIKKNCFLIRHPGKKKRKQKFILGSQVGVGGRRDFNLIGLGKGDGVLRHRSDLGGGDFLIAGKKYCAMNVRLTRKIPYQYS